MTDAQLATRREPLHPADFERREAAERRTREEVRAASRVEPAAHLRERRRDHQRHESHADDEEGAPAAGRCGQRCGQREDGAADDLIDANRAQVPAPELAAKRRRTRGRRVDLSHRRQVVS